MTFISYKAIQDNNLKNRFNKDYYLYKDFISQILDYDFSIEDDINSFSFSDIIKFNCRTSFTDLLLMGKNSLFNNQDNILNITKCIITSFIKKYWHPLIDLCYNYIYNNQFKSMYAFSNENYLLFIPTKIYFIYELKDEINNLTYTNSIYENEIIGLDNELNKRIFEKEFKEYYFH